MSLKILEELQQRFTVPGVVFNTGEGGLKRIEVQTPAARGEIYLHGAHVTGYQPMGEQEMLFISAKSQFAVDKPIRGGVPVIFPWFGAKSDDARAPMHGFARLAEWEVQSIAPADDGGVTVDLRFLPPPNTSGSFPHAFELSYRVSFGKSLRLSLAVRNAGPASWKFEEALHSYFAVSDVRNVVVTGLENSQYISKTQNMQRQQQGDESLRITQETDRVYQNTTAACVIDDPGMGRRITISKRESRSTVVWNPWIDKARAMADFGDEEWPDMICVETCNVGENAVQLAGGAEHRMEAEIRSEKV